MARYNRDMAIVSPALADYPGLVDLTGRRLPHLQRTELDFPVLVPVFQASVHVRADVDEDGSVLGWGWIGALHVFPPGWAMVQVFVAAQHQGSGVGSRLHAALLDLVPEGTTTLRALVREEDPRTHAITAHWGYQLVQRSIVSRLRLVDLPHPVLPESVTIAEGLDVPDPDAVDAMLQASQTNPEAADHMIRLDEVRRTLDSIPHPLALVARVGGVPAGIIYGGVPDGTMLVLYAGVDPTFRGRGLARLLKQQAHLDAIPRGGTQVLTQNEEHNTGIRRINAELGFEQLYVEHRLARRP